MPNEKLIKNISIIGKFPPIQGGVSASVYWAANALATNGFNVQVITNSNEVEFGYRQFTDECFLSSSFQKEKGSLTIHNTSPLNCSYIPSSKSYFSRLLGLALSVIAETDSDLIIGWYFEPYGLVASIAGKLLGKPVILRHAGSDIGNLALHPNLSRSYNWMLNNANYILSSIKTADLLITLGASKQNIYCLGPNQLPSVFLKPAQPLNINLIASLLTKFFPENFFSLEVLRQLTSLNNKPFDENLFTIGVYGKIGQRKGSYALLETLNLIAKNGIKFNFITIPCSSKEGLLKYFMTILNKPELARRTWILPPLPPWQVPRFLQSCTATCFLEHNFPIEFHTPIVPREILSSGSCFICSSDTINKLSFRNNLVDMKNFISISDPNDVNSFSTKLTELILEEEKNKAKTIGKHGKYTSNFLENQYPVTHPLVSFIESII